MQGRLKVPVNHSAQTVIQMVSVLYLIAWSVSPPLQIDLIFRLLALGLAFVWFLIEFVRRFEFTPMQIWCAIFMVAVALITYILNGAGSVIGEISVYMMVLAYFISIYSSDSWQNYEIVVPITLGLLIFFNYRTATALSEDAAIARMLVRDTEELYAYFRRGVGGYGLVYPQVCIAPVVYAWTIKSFERNKFYFLLGLGWAVSFWAVIKDAGYSIAIIVAALSLAVLILYRRKSVVPAFVISFVLLAGTILLLVYVEDFRNLVLRVFEGTKVVRKIEDLLSTAEGETADSFSSRITRYEWSLQSAFQYPIIGGRLFGARIGGHSEILDTFAKYGVWGGVPLLVIMFHVQRYFKTNYPSVTVIVTANAHITAVALVGLLDPFSYQFFFPLLILCPVMYHDIYKWRGHPK